MCGCGCELALIALAEAEAVPAGRRTSEGAPPDSRLPARVTIRMLVARWLRGPALDADDRDLSVRIGQ